MIHPHDKAQMRHTLWTAVFSDYSASVMSKAECWRSQMAEFITSSHYAGIFSRTPSYITFLKRINSIICSIMCAIAEAVLEVADSEPDDAVAAWADAAASPSAVNVSNEAEALGHLSYCLNSPDCQIEGKSATVTLRAVTGSVFSIHKKPVDDPGLVSFQEKWRRIASLTTATITPSSMSLTDKDRRILLRSFMDL